MEKIENLGFLHRLFSQLIITLELRNLSTVLNHKERSQEQKFPLYYTLGKLTTENRQKSDPKNCDCFPMKR